MQSITKKLTEIVSDAFEKCGYERSLGVVTASDRLDLCQFQCNGAFAGAKLYKKAPFMLADDVAAVLKAEDIFSKVEVVKPGFLNLSLCDDYMLALTREIAEDKFCGIPQAEKPEKIVIDYGGPNVAKPLHIGHLRSAIIGESLKRLARACGNTVYSDVHLGDWGLQIGLVIAELNERNPGWKCFSEDFDPDKDSVPELNADLLSEVYPFASKKSKEDEAFKEKDEKYREWATRETREKKVEKVVMVPLIISHDGAVHKDTVRRWKGFSKDIKVDWVRMAQNVLRYNVVIVGSFFNKGSWVSEKWRKDHPEEFDDEDEGPQRESSQPESEMKCYV